MDCNAARRLIPAYLDGELNSAKTTDLAEHIASCEVCTRETAAIKRTMAAMGTCAGMEPAFTLADIRERAARRRPLAQVWLGQLMRPATAALVVAALAIGSGSGIYYSTHLSAHSRRVPAPVSRQSASDSFGLDAFDDGLSGSVFVADARAAADGGGRR
jgi:anti-sigma factor RsiW